MTEQLTEEFFAPGGLSWPMLERERELAALHEVRREALEGAGHCVLITGPPGIGKSLLIAEGNAASRADGFRVLSARGGAFERDHPFGVVQQLLDRALGEAGPEERTQLLAGAAQAADRVLGARVTAIPTDESSALRGLYWLTANLSETRPLLISVDDLHHVDAPSLRFLVHLCRRAQGLRLAMVLGVRAGEEGSEPDLLRALTLESRSVIRPRPLSERAVESLVEAALGRQVAPAVSATCAEMTGGNPFLLVELLDALSDLDADAVTPNQVRRFAPDRVMAMIVERLRGLPESAVSLAHAVATLGWQATIEHAAALAGTDVAAARGLLALLVRADILVAGEPIGFAHPLIREAVYTQIPATERDRLHRQAAQLLVAYGAAAESAAIHLMVVEPAADEWVVDALRTAAGSAAARGAADVAARYLRRALQEHVVGELRVGMLVELGMAATRAGQSDGIALLQEALALVDSQPRRAEVGLALVAARAATNADPEQTMQLVEEALQGAEDAELPAQLESMLLLFIVGLPAMRQRFGWFVQRARERLPDLPVEALSVLSSEISIADGDARRAAELAETALARGDLIRRDILSEAAFAMPALLTLVEAGQLRAAKRSADEAVELARASGSQFALVRFLAIRALVHYRRGELRGAEMDAQECAELATEPAWGLAVALASAVIAAVHVERDEPAAALALLGSEDTAPGVQETISTVFVKESRVRALLAAGEPEAALVRLQEFARWTQVHGVAPGVELMSWRSLAVRAHLAGGRVSQARRLAGEELALARRYGAATKIGVALRSAGSAKPAGSGIALLQEAVEVLRGTDAELEHAHAEYELASRLAAAGKRSAARDVLAEAMERGHACGATGLVDRARTDLHGLGARPRRIATAGRDALTPRQLRVAELAAQELSNREIAEALFLTVRAVEMHLSNAYRTLNISSRHELERALRVPAAGTRPAS